MIVKNGSKRNKPTWQPRRLPKGLISHLIQIVFVFFLTIGVAGYFSYLGVDPHHDGIMLKPASDIARGQMLFRDTFTQYGALTTILQAWAVAVFGHSLVVINLLTVFFYGLVAVMLWLVWALFLPPYLATVACIIWLFQAPYHDPGYAFLPWPSVYALFFQLVTLYALLKMLQTKKGRWQLLAGISSALTFWSRQPVGFLLMGSIVFFFFTLKLKKYKFPSLLPFFVSLIITHLIFFVWILSNNAFADWFYQTIRFPATWATSASPEKVILLMNFFYNMFPNSYSPLSIWTLLPLVILYLGYTHLMTKKINRTGAMILLAVCVNLASWLQYHPVNDPRHLYWAAAPMIGFALYAALSLNTDKKKNFTFLVICFLLFVPDMFYHARLARRKIRKFWSYPTIVKPNVLKGMRVPPEEKRFFDDAMNKLETFKKVYPSSFVTTTGRDAMYSLFDGGNTNCYKFTVEWGWIAFDTQLEKDYLKAMKSCITKYKPAVFTQKLYYHPKGYKRVTKGESQTGNYLLLPQ